MSATYNVEPQPTAKVLLQTTAGDIELELFAKQIPRASRNFLQLCLDGYYDNTIFHRLVPKFIIQGGDPSGTGHGGESSFDGEPFEDEFHSRLKFNRRGLLGMANTGGKNDNGSQFFITLAETPELQGKNTMFGRVVGDTIYNVMKMGDADLAADGSDRPLYPQKITGTEILVNPFDDMVKRARVAQRSTEEKREKKKPKRKAGKALLSFGGDEGDDSIETPLSKKPKFNAKLVSAGDTGPRVQNNTAVSQAPEVAKPSKPQGKPLKKQKSVSKSRSASPVQKSPAQPAAKASSNVSESPSVSRSPSPKPTRQSVLERTNAQIVALKASMKRDTGAKSEPAKKKSALEEMIPETSTRGRRRRGLAANGAGNEDKGAMAFLQAFRSRLEAAPAEDPSPAKTSIPSAPEPQKDTNAPSVLDEGNADDEAHLCDLHFIANCQSCGSWDNHGAADPENDDAGWMSHALTFEKDRLGKDLEWKRKNEEDLVVIDPREKAKELKGETRGAKDAKSEGRSNKHDRRDRVRH